MGLVYQICRGITLGIIIGFVAGGFKIAFPNKECSQRKVGLVTKMINQLANILKYITFLVLSLGLVWCCYFLVLGIVVPAQVDYANDMAELIVSVLTVISIIFAFVEFSRRK